MVECGGDPARRVAPASREWGPLSVDAELSRAQEGPVRLAVGVLAGATQGAAGTQPVDQVEQVAVVRSNATEGDVLSQQQRMRAAVEREPTGSERDLRDSERSPG